MAAAALLVALGLTQLWFPWNYLRLAFQHSSPWSGYLLARDLALVGLAALLAWPPRVHEPLTAHGAALDTFGTARVQAE
jgi:hypothetical protein